MPNKRSRLMKLSVNIMTMKFPARIHWDEIGGNYSKRT